MIAYIYYMTVINYLLAINQYLVKSVRGSK